MARKHTIRYTIRRVLSSRSLFLVLVLIAIIAFPDILVRHGDAKENEQDGSRHENLRNRRQGGDVAVRGRQSCLEEDESDICILHSRFNGNGDNLWAVQSRDPSEQATKQETGNRYDQSGNHQSPVEKNEHERHAVETQLSPTNKSKSIIKFSLKN